MISKFCRDAGVIQGERLDIVVKIVKLLLGIRLKELVKEEDQLNMEKSFQYMMILHSPMTRQAIILLVIVK